jgi:hypothetical protein
MNQGIAFARTLRALEADDFRASKLGLLGAALVIAAWVWWLVGARVPQYESTTNVRVEDGRAIAYFPSMGGIAAGQPALLHVDGKTISAQVQAVAPDHVELAWPANSQQPTAISIDIEVSRISPASLALRVLGRR